MEYKYDINGTIRTIELEGSGDSFRATIEGKTYSISASPTGDGCLLMRVDKLTYPVRYARDERGLHLMVKGLNVIAREPDESRRSDMGDHVELVDGKQILVAPMPGQVVKVNVSVGDVVERKQCLVIVEAMKMENELNTAINGTVTAVHVIPGQQVDALQPLVEVTQAEVE
jgi:biotin carboxyl carrier protein